MLGPNPCRFPSYLPFYLTGRALPPPGFHLSLKAAGTAHVDAEHGPVLRDALGRGTPTERKIFKLRQIHLLLHACIYVCMAHLLLWDQFVNTKL